MNADDKELSQVAAADAMETKAQKQSSGWAGLAKLAAAIGVVGGITFHFLGHVSHDKYLKMLGVDPGQFPKSLDWLGINGYYTFFDRTNTILHALAANWLSLGLLWLLTTALVAYLYFLHYLSNSPAPERIVARLARHFPRRLQFPLMSVALGGLLSLFVPAVLIVTVLTLAVPALLGESGGEAAAKAAFLKFQAGCDKALLGQGCFEIRKDGQLIARGFLIDSSETHIALFDVNQKRSRVINRSGTELIADPTNFISEDKNNTNAGSTYKK